MKKINWKQNVVAHYIRELQRSFWTYWVYQLQNLVGPILMIRKPDYSVSSKTSAGNCRPWKSSPKGIMYFPIAMWSNYIALHTSFTIIRFGVAIVTTWRAGMLAIMKMHQMNESMAQVQTVFRFRRVIAGDGVSKTIRGGLRACEDKPVEAKVWRRK